MKHWLFIVDSNGNDILEKIELTVTGDGRPLSASVGEGLVKNKKLYKVIDIVWDYDDNEVCVYVQLDMNGV